MSVLKPTNRVLLQEINGEAILLNLQTETYFQFNKTALRMWQVLTSFETLDEAIEQLAEEFETDKLTLRSDIDEFIEILKRAQLAETGHK